MHEPMPGPVVVAVPHAGVESALRFAAREALVRGCSLEVVGPAAAPGVLSRAAAVAEVLTGPGVVVEARPVVDAAVATVLASHPAASLIVVDHSSSLHLLQALAGMAAAASPPPPIAFVPRGWSPRPGDTRPVVLAVDHAFDAGERLRTGAEQARIHDAPLQVVHAWDLRTRLRAAEDDALRRLWTGELEERLREQLLELAAGLPVVLDVRRGTAADLVLEAAAQAQLLVLGCDTTAPGHLGRTTRSALHASPCPVLLLPGATTRGRVATPYPTRADARGQGGGSWTPLLTATRTPTRGS